MLYLKTMTSSKLHLKSLKISKFRSKLTLKPSQAVDNPVYNPVQNPLFPVDNSVDNFPVFWDVDNPLTYPQVIHRKVPLIHNFVHKMSAVLDSV